LRLPVRGGKAALTVYRISAWVTGVGLVLLCIFWGRELVLDNFMGATPEEVVAAHKPVALIGMCHGFLYMIYVVCTLVLAERCRWKPVRALIIAAAGTIPFASFFAERKVTKLVHERIAALAV
jgi:integral membrane protein